MEWLFLAGRVLVGGFFLMNAMNHFTKTKVLAEYAKSKGVPSPQLAVLGTGVLLLAGGASILLGVWVNYGVLALTVFFGGVSFKMHNFWAMEDPQMKMMEMVQFTKEMAILGGLWMALAIPQPWPMSLGMFY